MFTREEDNKALCRARNACKNLQFINLVVSLGGGKYMCKHPASMTHAMIPQEQRMKGGSKDGFIHISVELERARDLVDDIRNLLDICDDEGCDVPEELWISTKDIMAASHRRCGGGIYIYRDEMYDVRVMINEIGGTSWLLGGWLCRVPKYIFHQIPRE